jgi:hypothetical protein
MQPLYKTVDVIIERVPLANRWASERWQPQCVELVEAVNGAAASRERVPGTCETAPADASGNRWRCRAFDIELHPTESEGYFLNITAPDPRVFVAWRFFDDGVSPRARPVLVTVSYNEASRFMDSGEQVDGVPMPREIAEWMHAFVAVHYKPEPRRKVRRNDPLAETSGSRRDRHS